MLHEGAKSRQKQQFFVSYSRSDRIAVDQLTGGLRRRGYKLWMDVDPRGIEPGEDWRDELRLQMSRSEGVVACLSPDFLRSPYCQDEIRQALDESKAIYPVIVRRLDVGQSPADVGIGDIQFVDVTQYYEITFKKYVAGLPRPPHILSAPYRRWLAAGISTVLLLLSIVLAVVASNMLNPKIEPMATGFNVVVMGFGVQGDNGEMLPNDMLGNTVSELIAGEIEQIDEVDNVRSWQEAGYITNSEADTRRRQAAQIADSHNANLVIYGIVTRSGTGARFKPEYYVRGDVTGIDSDLVNGAIFPVALPISPAQPVDSFDSIEINQQISALRHFINGMVKYTAGNFNEAYDIFFIENIDEAHDLEYFYIFAGNAANRANMPAEAIEAFMTALSIRPDYARAYVGLGVTFWSQAVQLGAEDNVTYDADYQLPDELTCPEGNNQIPERVEAYTQYAQRCYQQALIAAGDNMTEGDVDMKVAFGLGQIYTWQSDIHGLEQWQAAQEQLIFVTSAYEAANPTRQTATREFTGQAYASLGRIAYLQARAQNDDIDLFAQAATYYERAVVLLADDVNNTYNEDTRLAYETIASNLRSIINRRQE